MCFFRNLYLSFDLQKEREEREIDVGNRLPSKSLLAVDYCGVAWCVAGSEQGDLAEELQASVSRAEVPTPQRK